MTITREYLELAALAAGKRVVVLAVGRSDFDALDLDANAAWRPHRDDGDAARLAVRLGMLTDVLANTCSAAAMKVGLFAAQHDGTETDKLRAWREAVVLCAADVGKRMKGGA